MQHMLKDVIVGLKETNERISSLERATGAPEMVIVEEMTKEEAKQKVIDYMREHKTSDIAELHKSIGCDIKLLVEIIDELRQEGKIEEG
jgi:oligoribonuclease (3'-5' exoribonuclease)